MDSHKRILGIIFVISGSLEILIYVVISSVLAVILPSIMEHAHEVEDQWAVTWIIPFLRVIFISLIFVTSIPSIIGGIGLVNGKKWALTLVLILGCFKLFSFPIGTAIGIYTIWVYTEVKKQLSHAKQV